MKKNKSTSMLLLCLAVTVVFLFGTAGFAEESSRNRPLEIKPKILTGDDYHLWTPAVSYKFAYRNTEIGNYKLGHITLGDFRLLADIDLTGTISGKRSLNKEGLVSKASFGLDLLSGEPAGDGGYKPDDVADPGTAADKGYWGKLGLTAALRHESDQIFDEQQLAAGAELMYINSETDGMWAFIPSVNAAYEYVDPLRSDIRTDLNLTEKGFERARVEASLKCDIGQFMERYPVLQPIILHLDYRYFRAHGRDENRIIHDRETTTYRAGTIGYHLSSLTCFVGVSDGRLPTGAKDETIVNIGVIVPLDKLAKKQ